MLRTLVLGQERGLYEYVRIVDTNSMLLFEAQAELRWFGYHIPPERCYDWFKNKLRAVIR